MKKTLFKLLLTAVLFCLFPRAGSAQTPVSAGPFCNSVGQVVTNPILMYAWPQPQNTIIVSGTNIIYAANVVTNNPNGQGYFSNSFFPNTYAIKIPSLGSQVFAFARIPATTNLITLASCLTNVAVFNPTASNYSYITNLLGFAPATNTSAMIIATLGFFPQPASVALSNLTAGTTIFLTNNSVITSFDALGQFFKSNMVTHTSIAIDSNSVIWINGNAWPTNPAYYETNGAGNAARAWALTNQWTATNMPAFTGDATNLDRQTVFTLANVIGAGTALKVSYDSKGRVIGTNAVTLSDMPPLTLIGALTVSNDASFFTNGFITIIVYKTNAAPGSAYSTLPNGSLMLTTNGQPYTLVLGGWQKILVSGQNTLADLPALSAVGQTNANASLLTNGLTVWVSYKTNNVPNGAYTNLPNGSLMTTTNGSLLILSNNAWVQK